MQNSALTSKTDNNRKRKRPSLLVLYLQRIRNKESSKEQRKDTQRRDSFSKDYVRVYDKICMKKDIPTREAERNKHWAYF